MKNALFVRGLDDGAQTLTKLEDLVDLDRAPHPNTFLLEGFAFQELGHEEGATVVRHSIVEDAHDVRMVDAIGERTFAAKSRDECWMVQKACVKDLDGDAALVRVPRNEHGSRAALTKEAFDGPLAPKDRAQPGVWRSAFHSAGQLAREWPKSTSWGSNLIKAKQRSDGAS
jgi:hypothetical protein